MQYLSLRNHKSFYRKSIAEQIAVSAGADFIYMGFFDCQQSLFVDWWNSRGATDIAEPDPQQILNMIRQIDKAVIEAGRCDPSERTASFDQQAAPASAVAAHWTHSNGYLIGIGAEVQNLLPVVIVLGDVSPDAETRNTSLCIGMSYVEQELYETIPYSAPNPNDAIMTALSMLSVHFAVVDSYGNIDYSTDLSEGLLECNGGFEVQSGRLTAVRNKTQKVFTHALRMANGPARKPAIVSVEGEKHDDVSKIIVIMPVSKSSPPRSLVIFEQSEDDPVLRDHLLKLSGLTASERRITHHLLEGKSLAEAAEATNLSLSTVRSYMKGIFSKTSTHRQSELITRFQNAVPQVRYSNIAKPVDVTTGNSKH